MTPCFSRRFFIIKMNKKTVVSLSIISIILLLDQWSKMYVKTTFELYEKHEVFKWFQIVFVENDGMAWGATISDFIPRLSDRLAKLFLTLFRIVAITGIGYWLYKSLKSNRNHPFIAISLVFAGALGNIIDSIFYGLIFTDSRGELAVFFPEKGYDDLFYGKVVDMLHFPLWEGVIYDQVPIIGGRYFSFFDPVFNIADVAISVGIFLLLIFNRKSSQNAYTSKGVTQ